MSGTNRIRLLQLPSVLSDLIIVSCMLISGTKSCLTLCDITDCSLPGSSVHGISQARILGWIAISFSRGFSRPKNQTQVSYIGKPSLYHCAIREAHLQDFPSNYCFSYCETEWDLVGFPRGRHTHPVSIPLVHRKTLVSQIFPKFQAANLIREVRTFRNREQSNGKK